ncbi:hypothetical protein GRD98_19970 (plasmid) [Ralstonia solanacearum]|nr:hypothetical protein GRD98_19970 [Ralstonia solanacearum]
MLIGIPLQTAEGETRVALTPETAKKLKAQGHVLRVQTGAGWRASIPDQAYEAAGCEMIDAAGAFGADLVLTVRPPAQEDLARMRPGAALVGMLDPYDKAGLDRLAAAGLTSFALEAAPRTTRAQSMDVLSSQANVAGYKAVLVASDRYQRFFPMLMTAAGTVKAARIVILGVGVAGLQAIATAKRLGAVVEATDVRPAVKEQVESLGAKFIQGRLGGLGPLSALLPDADDGGGHCQGGTHRDPGRRGGGLAGHRHGQAPGRRGRSHGRSPRSQGAGRIAGREVHRRALRDR